MIDISPFQEKLKVLDLYMKLWIHVRCSKMRRADWLEQMREEIGSIPYTLEHNMPPFEQFYAAYCINQHKMRMKIVENG